MVVRIKIFLMQLFYSINFLSKICFLDSPTYSSMLGSRVLQIPAQSRISIPLTHTDVQMFVKPVVPNGLYQYCMEPIDWTAIKKQSEVVEIQTTCRTNQQNLFRMSVAIKRDNYPMDTLQTLPGHTISILAPITLTNLLPHELLFTAGSENGRIGPGKSSDLISPNLNDQLEISIQLDGYPGAGTVRSFLKIIIKFFFFFIICIFF